MARSPEGEYELVLGNKQLLSLFFLVVVLFAVFFSLGYMVGRSVSPSPSMAAQPQPAPAASPEVSPLPSGEKPPAREAAPAGNDAEPAPPVIETEPARAEPASAPADREAAVSQTVEARSAPAGEPKQSPLPPAGASAGDPESTGAIISRELHLQIAAVRVREDAEALIESLHKKGYKAVLNAQARDGWYRVLIGPFPNERAAQQMKAALEKDGFKSILRRP
jgi:cell division septation protein DedD